MMLTRCDVHLSCGHVEWLFDTTAAVADKTNDKVIGDFLKTKKNGGWAARRCKRGCGRRRVISVRQYRKTWTSAA